MGNDDECLGRDGVPEPSPGTKRSTTACWSVVSLNGKMFSRTDEIGTWPVVLSTVGRCCASKTYWNRTTENSSTFRGPRRRPETVFYARSDETFARFTLLIIFHGVAGTPRHDRAPVQRVRRCFFFFSISSRRVWRRDSGRIAAFFVHRGRIVLPIRYTAPSARINFPPKLYPI